MWFRIEFIPRLQPCAERVLVCSPYIDAFRFCDSFRQLFFHFCLCLAENALDDSFTVFFIVSSGISPFPSSILALADVAFTVCPFLCQVRASFVLVAQTTTTEPAQSLLIFSEDRNIFSQICTRQKSYSLFTAAQFLRSPASIFILDFFTVCFIMVLCKMVFV